MTDTRRNSIYIEMFQMQMSETKLVAKEKNGRKAFDTLSRVWRNCIVRCTLLSHTRRRHITILAERTMYLKLMTGESINKKTEIAAAERQNRSLVVC